MVSSLDFQSSNEGSIPFQNTKQKGNTMRVHITDLFDKIDNKTVWISKYFPYPLYAVNPKDVTAQSTLVEIKRK